MQICRATQITTGNKLIISTNDQFLSPLILKKLPTVELWKWRRLEG